MSLLETHAARALVTIFCFVLCLAFIYFSRQTLIAFLFAIFFAYLLAAPIEYFERRGANQRNPFSLCSA